MIDRLNEALEGRYRIERELGEGGMATVYLAHDVRHERRVAIKVLRPELAAVVGAERFLAEIRTTAQLQHPHILTLHDSGEADGFLFYVMPYVQGESLRERLKRERQLPVDEAVELARKVADALDYAHERGVVHRDVKPANVLLSERGEPLVADFGIALALQQAGEGRLTETGLSLGTPHYMSPEQATGERHVDARSDVYSLACMLYEMLTGDPPYTGSTAQAVLGRIITGEPPRAREVRKSVPPHVEAAILHALEKLPADRPASAARFAAELSGEQSPPTAGARDSSRDGTRLITPGARLERFALATVTLALVAVLVLYLAQDDSTNGSDPTVRAILELPAGATLVDGKIALSPDGGTLVVSAIVDNERILLRRPLDALEFRPVVGAERGADPSFSPDGRWLLFGGIGGLRRVPVEGGGAVTLSDGPWPKGAAWTHDGRVVFPRAGERGLGQIRAGGDTLEELTRPDTAAGEYGHWWPQALPDGEHVLFTAVRTPVERSTLTVVSLETGELVPLWEGGVFGRYAPTGHLLYAAGGVVFAVPFDPDRLEAEGPAVPVLEGVAMEHGDAVAAFDVSRNGTLVYAPAEDRSSGMLVWVDRSGRETPILPDTGSYRHPAISPGGDRMAFTLEEGGRPSDLWVVDMARGTRTQLTSGGGVDREPVWTPDGERVVFLSERPVFDLYMRAADARAPAEPLVESPADKHPYSMTPDGDTLLYLAFETAGPVFRKVSVRGGGSGESIPVPGWGVSSPALSPDGRWLAYTSLESGQSQVYLVRYGIPEAGRSVVSTVGWEPRWTRGGREIVYRDYPAVIAVPVDPESGELGKPDTLFQGDYRLGFDVTSDGQRFAMVKPTRERIADRLVVVTNFFRELRDLTGEGAR